MGLRMLTNGAIEYQAHYSEGTKLLRLRRTSDEKLGCPRRLSLSLGLLDSFQVGFCEGHLDTLDAR